MESWLKKTEKGTQLFLYIQPGASKDEVSGVHDGRLKIKIKALPQDGEANEGLIEFLAKKLKVSKKKVFLLQGESSRHKIILVELSLEEVRAILSG